MNVTNTRLSHLSPLNSRATRDALVAPDCHQDSFTPSAPAAWTPTRLGCTALAGLAVFGSMAGCTQPPAPPQAAVQVKQAEQKATDKVETPAQAAASWSGTASAASSSEQELHQEIKALRQELGQVRQNQEKEQARQKREDDAKAAKAAVVVGGAVAVGGLKILLCAISDCR